MIGRIEMKLNFSEVIKNQSRLRYNFKVKKKKIPFVSVHSEFLRTTHQDLAGISLSPELEDAVVV
jgi:hypothetical protein